MRKNQHVFAWSNFELGRTKTITLDIDAGDSTEEDAHETSGESGDALATYAVTADNRKKMKSTNKCSMKTREQIAVTTVLPSATELTRKKSPEEKTSNL